MTPNGRIAIPLDIAAIREPFLAHRFWQGGVCPVCGQNVNSLHLHLCPQSRHDNGRKNARRITRSVAKRCSRTSEDAAVNC